MSDVEKLRLDVINAAREEKLASSGCAYRRCSTCPECIADTRVRRALAALDEAEKPDPWQLLREAQLHIDRCGEWLPDQTNHGKALLKTSTTIANHIEAALVWKEAQQ